MSVKSDYDFDFDMDSVKVNPHAKYLCQESFLETLLYGHKHTPDRLR